FSDFLSLYCRPPPSTLFPYTTLFRSDRAGLAAQEDRRAVENLVQGPERQIEVRLAHDDDDQEVEPAGDQLQHRQGQELHEVLGLLLEPLVLRLEGVDRSTPEFQVCRRARARRSLLSLHRLPSQDGEQCRGPE